MLRESVPFPPTYGLWLQIFALTLGTGHTNLNDVIYAHPIGLR